MCLCVCTYIYYPTNTEKRTQKDLFLISNEKLASYLLPPLRAAAGRSQDVFHLQNYLAAEKGRERERERELAKLARGASMLANRAKRFN